MHNFANVVLWIYIVLLFVGGLMGFLKAKSQVSLFMSAGFAVALIITTVLQEPTARHLVNILMAALLIVFTVRLAKTKKFMPAGMMLVITIAALALRNIPR